MRRRLLTILSAVSLIICLPVIVFWLRDGDWIRHGYSLEGTEYIGIGSNGVYSHGGRIGFVHTESGAGPLSAADADERAEVPIDDAELGWVWTRSDDDDGILDNLFLMEGWNIPHCLWVCNFAETGGHRSARGMAVTLNAPVLLAILSLPAVLMMARFIRRRFAAGAGCCVQCGYDLRATPNRCPECGAVPAGGAK